MSFAGQTHVITGYQRTIKTYKGTASSLSKSPGTRSLGSTQTFGRPWAPRGAGRGGLLGLGGEARRPRPAGLQWAAAPSRDCGDGISNEMSDALTVIVDAQPWRAEGRARAWGLGNYRPWLRRCLSQCVSSRKVCVSSGPQRNLYARRVTKDSTRRAGPLRPFACRLEKY